MIDKNIILHIGLYKAGSTFIQRHYESVDLDEYKIFLPKSKINVLILEYLANPNNKIKEEIKKIIQNEKSQNILIGSERIFGHQYYQFKDCSVRFQLLEELFNKPKYILFFREPSSIIYSGYFQGLQKSYSLKFENYINENKNDLKNRNFYNYFARGVDFKIYNYNDIFKDYLKIQNRVLFVRYEKFFLEKNVNYLNKFTGLNIKFNFTKKRNESLKNLIYLEFFNNYFVFKCVKLIWLQINSIIIDYKKSRDISLRICILINFLIKFIPKKYINKIEENHRNLLEKIKSYHAENYKNFKRKLNPTQHVV